MLIILRFGFIILTTGLDDIDVRAKVRSAPMNYSAFATFCFCCCCSWCWFLGRNNLKGNICYVTKKVVCRHVVVALIKIISDVTLRLKFWDEDAMFFDELVPDGQELELRSDDQRRGPVLSKGRVSWRRPEQPEQPGPDRSGARWHRQEEVLGSTAGSCQVSESSQKWDFNDRCCGGIFPMLTFPDDHISKKCDKSMQ